MMSEPQQIKIGDQAVFTAYTESEYEALEKENVLLKQTVEEQCGRVIGETQELRLAIKIVVSVPPCVR